MDPDANLAEQDQILADGRHERGRLAELREALREWLQRGGFEPQWHRAPRAAAFYGRGIGHAVSVPHGGGGLAGWLRYSEVLQPFGRLTFEDRPMPWQLAGRTWTATGYGAAIPSRRVAVLPDGTRRRVFVTQYSNSGTAWIKVRGVRVIVSDSDAGAAS